MADFTRPYFVNGVGWLRDLTEVENAIEQTRHAILTATTPVADNRRILRRLQYIHRRARGKLTQLEKQLAEAQKEIKQLKERLNKHYEEPMPIPVTLATYKGKHIQAKWGYNHNIISANSPQHDIAGIVMRELYISGEELIHFLYVNTRSQLRALGKHAPTRPVQALVRAAKSAPPPTDNWQHIITPLMSLEYRIKPAYYDATIAP